MTPWYKLNIDTTDCFLPNYTFPTPTGLYGVWHPKASEVFNRQWLIYLLRLGIPLYTVMIFYRGPGASTAHAHVDVAKPDPLKFTPWGINWVFGGKDSKMTWYEPQTVTKEDISYTAAKTPYIHWPIKNLKEIDNLELTEKNTYLVRTDIPHSIKMSSDPRWCFSARLSIPDSINWESTVNMLKSKNLLVER